MQRKLCNTRPKPFVELKTALYWILAPESLVSMCWCMLLSVKAGITGLCSRLKAEMWTFWANRHKDFVMLCCSFFSCFSLSYAKQPGERLAEIQGQWMTGTLTCSIILLMSKTKGTPISIDPSAKKREKWKGISKNKELWGELFI